MAPRVRLCRVRPDGQRAGPLASSKAASETGEPVGACVVPGVSQVLALHGIMKSGAAYVPLDPELPVSRHAYMIRDLGLRTVVCDRLEERWAALDVPRIVHPLRAEPRTAQVASDQGPDDPAYILFTSGLDRRTGKAVHANTHAGIVNRLRWMQDTFLLRPGERVCRKKPSSHSMFPCGSISGP